MRAPGTVLPLALFTSTSQSGRLPPLMKSRPFALLIARSAWMRGVMFTLLDALPVPSSLCALTVHAYVLVMVRPATVSGEAVPLAACVPGVQRAS